MKKRRLPMKLLLVAVNAKYIHSNLAVYSLRAYANKYSAAGHVALAEYTINHSEEDILRGIYMEKADVIAFSCYIWNFEIILRVVKELKKVQPDAKLWFGGPEVSYDAITCLEKHSELTGIMIGEGEQTFLEVLQHYTEGIRSLDQIDGIAYREDHQVRMTKSREILELSEIPFPYEEMEDFKNRIIYYESSRGCPFSCSYCLSSIERTIRFREIGLVKQELQFLLEQKVPQVKFIDRTFNCKKAHAMEIWRFIKEHDNGVTNFHFEISADLLTEEELQLLASLRPAQVQFEIGVQTTNSDTVEAIHRKMDLNLLRRNVERIRAGRNIHQHLDLIAGLPFEDYASFERSFQEVYEMKPDQLQLGFLKVLKGSPMEAASQDYGIIYREHPPYEVLSTNHLSYEELLDLKGICDMVEIYYNSGQFANAIGYLEHFYSSPMKLYEELSIFYQNKQMDRQAHSRMKRYEILSDFFQEIILQAQPRAEKESGLEVLFEEILIMDLFLREDMKSRPTFAINHPLKNYKDLYDKLRKENKLIHIENFTYDIEAAVAEGIAVKKESTIIFNYSVRDPITKSAGVTIL
jgi:radical SAM superfamily enzyme YgiQ (UPF0313 family)